MGRSCRCADATPCENGDGTCEVKVRMTGEGNASFGAYCAINTTDCLPPQPFHPGDTFTMAYRTSIPYECDSNAVQDTSAGLQYETNAFSGISANFLTDLHGTSYSIMTGDGLTPTCDSYADGFFTADYFPNTSLFELRPHYAEKVTGVL